MALMLCRSHMGGDGSGTLVLICRTLEEGFDAVAGDLRSLKSQHGRLLVNVVGDSSVVDGHVVSWGRMPHVQKVVVSAGAVSHYSGLPRAHVSVAGVLWDGAAGSVPVDARKFRRQWKIEACPTGYTPEVHDIARTLVWDAIDGGGLLPEEDALRSARALVRDLPS